MRRRKLMGGTVWSAKCDRNVELSPRHHEHVGRVVDDLIERDQRKTPSHELDDWPKAGHGCADAQTRKPVLANGRVDDSRWTEAFEQTLADFVGSVVFGHFFAH